METRSPSWFLFFVALLAAATLLSPSKSDEVSKGPPAAEKNATLANLQQLVKDLEVLKKGPLPIADLMKYLQRETRKARGELDKIRQYLATKQTKLEELKKVVAGAEAREKQLISRIRSLRITVALLSQDLPNPLAIRQLSPGSEKTGTESSFSREQLASSRKLFERQVAPLLKETCQRCHNDKDRKGKLILLTRQAALTGGASGPALVPGRPQDSPIYLAISGELEPMMPPQEELEEAVIEAVRKWIATGAVWP